MNDKFTFSLKKTRIQETSDCFCGIIGKTRLMQNLFHLIRLAALDDSVSVLICGDSGTGKKLVAKAIHKTSKRKSKKFIEVDCAKKLDGSLERELFGFTKGAFAEAVETKQGLIHFADKGTLFLKKIECLDHSLQVKILRIILEKSYKPVGGSQVVAINTRILAATKCDLEKLVKLGRFNEELYSQFSGMPLNIPPLKERKEDIPLLIESFVENSTTKLDKSEFVFSKSALNSLLNYNWYGNVSELEEFIKDMSFQYQGRTVNETDLPGKFLPPHNKWAYDLSTLFEQITEQLFDLEPSSVMSLSERYSIEKNKVDFKRLIGDFETLLILHALRASGGNKKEAARLLNLKRTTLIEKIKKKKLNDIH